METGGNIIGDIMDKQDINWLIPVFLSVLIIGIGIGGLTACTLGVC